MIIKYCEIFRWCSISEVVNSEFTSSMKYDRKVNDYMASNLNTNQIGIFHYPRKS